MTIGNIDMLWGLMLFGVALWTTCCLVFNPILRSVGIMGMVHASPSFTELKALLETSDGNVSVHARKLEDAGYLACTKGFEGRIPRTEYRLTPEGHRALERYLAHMEALIRRVEGG